jgi:hypothetical protein
MEIIARLGSLLGVSFISGINLYATVATVGLCIKNGLVQGLPAELNVLANDGVIIVALFLFTIEFFVDKIPGFDTLWDALHTVIRPFGGAMLALMQVGEASPALEVIVFMLGASLASAAHITKAGTRLLVQASPEPFSNIILSLVEDVVAVCYTYVSITHPTWAFFLTLLALGGIAFVLPLLFRFLRMLLGAFLFRVKTLLSPDVSESFSRVLPLAFDEFFESAKAGKDEILWSIRAFAARIPSIPKARLIHVVRTPRHLYALYRKRFRLRLKQLDFSRIEWQRIYPGKILAKWLLRTPEETWLVQLYQPLVQKLSREIEPSGTSTKT